MPSTTIYKLCPASLWREAERAGVFLGMPIDRQDGYIHFSAADQVAETAAKHFAGARDLVLVAVDAEALGPLLKWEPSRGGALFPHLFRSMPLNAVRWVKPLPLDAAGRHVIDHKSWRIEPMTPPPATPSRHLPVRPDWLDQRHEEIIEPDLPIIDPHHHLWDRPGNRFLLPDLLGDVGSGHNIRATVFLECREMYRAEGPPELRSLGETEFVTGVAAMSASGKYGPTRCCAGIVGNVDLRIGARAGELLEQHVTASGGRFRGIRNNSTWHADPGLGIFTGGAPAGLLLDPGWRAGFATLAPLGLSFDAWMFHPQLGELLDLARAFPETRIVLNHVGGALAIGPYAGKRDAAFAEWSGHIRALGACPNIHVKLGGLGMRLGGFDFAERAQPPSSTDLAAAWRPYIETCIAAFRPERSMFESNFPVDKGMCSYAILWNAFKRLASGCSSDEKTALFSGTAQRCYRLW